ncbi:Large-conductance mechanosensitive channel (fragment) [Brochothrix thermosphacta]
MLIGGNFDFEKIVVSSNTTELYFPIGEQSIVDFNYMALSTFIANDF